MFHPPTLVSRPMAVGGPLHVSESHLPGPAHQTQINLSNQHTTRQYIEPYNATVVHTIVPQRVSSTSIPTVSRARGIGGGGVSVSHAGTSNDVPMQTEDEKAREDQIRRELELVVEMVESYARMYVRETHRALLGSDPSVPPLTNAPLFPSPIVSGVTVPAAAAGGMPAGGGGGVAGPTSLATGIHAILSHPSYLPSAIPTVEPLWQLMNKCQIGGASGGGPIAAKRRHDTTTAIATIVNSTNLGTGGITNDGVVKRESNAQVGTTNVVSGVSVRNPNHRSVNNTNVLTSVKRLKVSEQDYIASSKRSNNNTLAAAVDGGDDDDGANSPSPSASSSSSSSSSATSSDDDGDEEYAPRGGGGCAGRRRTRAGVNRRGKMTPKKATKTTKATKVTSRTLNNGRTTKAGRTVKMKVIEDSTIDGEEEEDDEYGDGVGSDEDQDDDASNVDDDDEYDFDPNDDSYRSVGGVGGGGSGHRVSKSSTSGGGGGGGGGGHSGSSRQRRSKLPLKSILTLRTFFVMHIDHPFPKDVEKRELAEECNLNFKQVSDWFTNTRKRFWRPYCEELLQLNCILGTKPFGECTCSSGNNNGNTSKKTTMMNKKKMMMKSKKRSIVKEEEGMENEDGEHGHDDDGVSNASDVDDDDDLIVVGPEHQWMKMWQ